jgi:hypothetical protein
MYALLVESQICASHRQGEVGVLPRPATDAWEAAPPSVATITIFVMTAVAQVTGTGFVPSCPVGVPGLTASIPVISVQEKGLFLSCLAGVELETG